jgi:hypothetical protein
MVERGRLWRESMPDGQLQIHSTLDDVVAYREASVGWAASRGSFEAQGQRVPVRMTVVVHREDGERKCRTGSGRRCYARVDRRSE